MFRLDSHYSLKANKDLTSKHHPVPVDTARVCVCVDVSVKESVDVFANSCRGCISPLSLLLGLGAAPRYCVSHYAEYPMGDYVNVGFDPC